MPRVSDQDCAGCTRTKVLGEWAKDGEIPLAQVLPEAVLFRNWSGKRGLFFFLSIQLPKESTIS